MNELAKSSTELIPASPADVAALLGEGGGKYATPAAERQMIKVGDYLPFIQLFGSNSLEVKKGDFPIGRFGVKKSRKIIDLGEEIVIFIAGWRPKAMQFKPKTLSYFDVTSEQFQEIEATADLKDSNKAFGPEFLVTLPLFNPHEFLTYFMGNKTGRNEAPNVLSLTKVGSDGNPPKRICIQKAILIEDGTYAWHGPQTLDFDQEFIMPDLQKLSEAVEKFNNPPASQEEVAEKAEVDERD